MSNKDDKHVILVISRKFMIGLIMTATGLFMLNVGNFLYTNFVDSRSNQALCNITKVFDSRDRSAPPTPGRGTEVAQAFDRFYAALKCK